MSIDESMATSHAHDQTGPRQAGPLTRAPRGKLRGTERDAIRAKVACRYECDGISIRGIRDEIDRSYGLVRRLLLEAEVPLRPAAHHP